MDILDDSMESGSWAGRCVKSEKLSQLPLAWNYDIMGILLATSGSTGAI